MISHDEVGEAQKRREKKEGKHWQPYSQFLCGCAISVESRRTLRGDLEEIEQDVEEQIQIAIANGEFDNVEGSTMASA